MAKKILAATYINETVAELVKGTTEKTTEKLKQEPKKQEPKKQETK